MSYIPKDAIEALKLVQRTREVHRAREIAYKRFQLTEQEFEALVQRDDPTAEQIEFDRAKLIASYEQYIDACLAYRNSSRDSEQRIEQMMKESKK